MKKIKSKYENEVIRVENKEYIIVVKGKKQLLCNIEEEKIISSFTFRYIFTLVDRDEIFSSSSPKIRLIIFLLLHVSHIIIFLILHLYFQIYLYGPSLIYYD